MSRWRFLLPLAAASAWNRRATLGLTLLAVILASTLLLAAERLRHEARHSFAQAVAGSDLIVGARGSPLQLSCMRCSGLARRAARSAGAATGRSPPIRRSPGAFRWRSATRIAATR